MLHLKHFHTVLKVLFVSDTVLFLFKAGVEVKITANYHMSDCRGYEAVIYLFIYLSNTICLIPLQSVFKWLPFRVCHQTETFESNRLKTMLQKMWDEIIQAQHKSIC